MKTKLFAATVLAVASASAFAVTPLGTIDNSSVSPSNLSVPVGFFFDTFTFTLAAPADISGGAFSFGIANFSVVLIDSSFTPITDSNPSDGFSFSGLTAGNYSLNFLGTVTGPGMGAYGGLVTAVPEPETYALMLAGLGIVGFVAARRRAQR